MKTTLSVEMSGICKSFYGSQVLDTVDLSIQVGEVHALLGHNGAGKSTLMKILLGIYQPDAGSIAIAGKEVSIRSPQDARLNGIAIVHQELNLFPHLSVAENMFLGREETFSTHVRQPQSLLGWSQRINKSAMIAKCAKALARVGLNIDPNLPVSTLSMGKRQLIEIAKGLSEDANILILDEPTSSLSAHEVENLFNSIKRLSSEGVSIIFISHRLEEVFRICDRITVLRDGRLVQTISVKQTDTSAVIDMMIGKSVDNLYAKGLSQPNVGRPMLKVKNLSLPGVYQDINLQVNQGEIVGLAGLIGAGRTEVLESIFGIRQSTSGSIEYDGTDMAVRHPHQVVNQGIGFVPEDRRTQGLFLKMNVGQNIGISELLNRGMLRLVGSKKQSAKVHSQIGELNIRTTGFEQQITELSGGNQQKVVLAKWFAKGIRLLLLDEPTRGVDISSKSEIYALIHRFAKNGGAVLMVSSELPEVIGLSDRIITFNKGRITGELTAAEATENSVMEMIV